MKPELWWKKAKEENFGRGWGSGLFKWALRGKSCSWRSTQKIELEGEKKLLLHRHCRIRTDPATGHTGRALCFFAVKMPGAFVSASFRLHCRLPLRR